MTSTYAAPGTTAVPTLGAITHVALTVRDLDVSVPFYRALIGAEPVLDEDTGPFRHVVFALGGTLFGLHQFPEGIDELAHSPRRWASPTAGSSTPITARGSRSRTRTDCRSSSSRRRRPDRRP